MNNELTDVYAIIKKELKEELEYYNLENNKELASFLNHNTYNEMFIGTDDVYYHNIYFKNLDTNKKSRIFKEGFIYFFPEGQDFITPDYDVKAFSIGKGVKCIKVNGNGLFIENTDLKENVKVDFYDIYALEEISKDGCSVANIDYIEDIIKNKGFSPDKTFTFNKKDGNIEYSVTEYGDTTVNHISNSDDRALYSIYYEYMKLNKYYLDNSRNIEQSTHKL